MSAAVNPSQQAPVKMQDNEKIVEVVRQHPWFLAWKVFLSVIIFIGFSAILRLLSNAIPALDAGPAAWIWLIGGLITLLVVFSLWYAYKNNLWAITNQRIIDSVKSVPWRQFMTSADLVNVQDVDVHISGVVASLFKFGDIRVQTSSASERGIVIKSVQDPQRILSLIDSLRDAARREQYRDLAGALQPVTPA